MSDQFATNIPKHVTIGNNVTIGGPDDWDNASVEPSSRSSSVMGQQNAHELKTAKKIWEASVAEFADEHKFDTDLDDSAGAFKPVEPDDNDSEDGDAFGHLGGGLQKMIAERERKEKTEFDVSQKLRTSIKPEDLKRTRVETLKKLPVYVAARPLEKAYGPMKKWGLHGFVAIGQPGLGDAGRMSKGAKVFSYGQTPMKSRFHFGPSAAKAIANAKDTIVPPPASNVSESAGNLSAKMLGANKLDRFPPEVVRTVDQMAKNGHRDFDTFQDFHRVYFTERMHQETRTNPEMQAWKSELKGLERKEKDPHAPPLTGQEQQRKTELQGNIINRTVAKHRDINVEAARIFMHLQEVGESKFFGDTGLHGQVANEKYDTTKQNDGTYKAVPITDDDGYGLAEEDARKFENKDYLADETLTLNEQKNVKATDVLEAQRMQTTARNYLDEKARVGNDSALAPELMQVPEYQGISYKKFQRNLQAQLSLADDYYAEKTYAPIAIDKPKPEHQIDKNKTFPLDSDPGIEPVVMPKPYGSDEGISKDAIKGKRRYQAVLSVDKDPKKIAGKVNFIKTFKRTSKHQLANDGNCNAAAGTLVRLAGRLNGKEVEVQAGDHQHGIHKDALWNPTPDQLRAQQTQHVFVSKKNEEVKAHSPMNPTTRSEIDALDRDAEALKSALGDLKEAGKLMEQHAPKPKIRFRSENFQPVRDAMASVADTLAGKGDGDELSDALDRLSRASNTFRTDRMEKRVKKEKKNRFDTKVPDMRRLKKNLDRPESSSGIKKMIIADFMSETATKIQAARSKIVRNLETTLARDPATLSEGDAQKLRHGAALLRGLGVSDSVLTDHMQTRVDKALDTYLAANGLK